MPSEEDIIQKIILEGDKVVLKQFADIARAGKIAFDQVQQSANKAATSGLGSGFTNVLNGVHARITEVSKVGAEMGRSFNQISSSVGQTARTMRNFTVIGGVVAGVLTAMIKAAAKFGDEIGDSAESLGLTIEKYQKMSIAASLVGIEQSKFNQQLTRFAQAADNAGQAADTYDKGMRALRRQFGLGKITIQQFTEQAADLKFTMQETDDPFKKLGVTIAKNKDGTVDLDETHKRLADSIEKTGITTNVLAQAQQLWGRGARQQLLLLKDGRKAYEAQQEEAKRLGLVLGADVIKRTGELSDEFDRLALSSKNTATTIAAVFAPTLTRLFRALIEDAARGRAAYVVMATQIVNKVVPIVEDLIALMEGRESDIGKDSIALTIRDGFNSAKEGALLAWEVIKTVFKGIKAAADTVAEAINGIFGTKLSGGALIAGAIFLKLLGVFKLIGPMITILVLAFKALALVLGGPVGIAIAAIVALIGVGLYLAITKIDFASIGKKLTDLWDGVLSAVRRTINGFTVLWNGALAGLTFVWEAIKSGFSFVWQFITDTANNFVAGLGVIWSGLIEGLTAAWQFIKDGAVGLWTAISDNALIASDYIKSIWTGFVEFIVGIWTSVQDKATAAWTWVSDQATTAVNYISGIFASLRDTIVGYWNSIRDGILAVWEKVKDIIGKIAGGGGAAASGSGAAGRATGGPIRGRGTGTSDNVPIWASNGEFMMRTAAVRKYGQGFMHAINSLRFDPQAFGMALGGLVSFDSRPMHPRMAYAEGGPISAGRGNTLNLAIDGQRFSGLRADDDTFDRLSKFASSRSLRSAGRKPTWKKG